MKLCGCCVGELPQNSDHRQEPSAHLCGVAHEYHKPKDRMISVTRDRHFVSRGEYP